MTINVLGFVVTVLSAVGAILTCITTTIDACKTMCCGVMLATARPSFVQGWSRSVFTHSTQSTFKLTSHLLIYSSISTISTLSTILQLRLQRALCLLYHLYLNLTSFRLSCFNVPWRSCFNVPWRSCLTSPLTAPVSRASSLLNCTCNLNTKQKLKIKSKRK